jgi:fructokinase
VSEPRVICLGEILFDLLADQRGKPIEAVESWQAYPGGAPANVACALVKLETPAAFIGCVGSDQAGDQLIKLLETTGVNTQGIQRHPTAPTRKVYVLRSTEGDREFAGFGDTPPHAFADAHLQGSKLPLELFQSAEFLVLGTLELAYPETRQAVFHALDLAEQFDLKVLVDINWRPRFWQDHTEAEGLIKQLWNRLDFLKLSTEEAQWLFNSTDAGVIAHQLESVEGVVVTGGEADVSYCLDSHEGKVPIFDVEVEDTTGAGDSFVAGFVHQLETRKLSSLQDPAVTQAVIRYACAVGGLTTTKPGAIASQPTAEEVEDFLASQGD